MDNKYSMESAEETFQVIQLLEDRIYEYNSAEAHIDDGRLFSRVVRNKDQEIIAGIAGWTWAGICEITQLWVDEKVRKEGIGKILLEAGELEAKTKGCHTILVRSYSFQAPHFYERHGYKIEHILNGFPKGHSYYILIKQFKSA
jgi:ribosomal protein S18 acetylase RimI-like enzyme